MSMQIAIPRPASLAAAGRTAMAGLTVYGPIGLALGATLLWTTSLSRIDVRHTTDLGLVSVLPPAYFVALALLTAGYCLALRRRPLLVPFLLLYVALLIMALYGFTS